MFAPQGTNKLFVPRGQTKGDRLTDTALYIKMVNCTETTDGKSKTQCSKFPFYCVLVYCVSEKTVSYSGWKCAPRAPVFFQLCVDHSKNDHPPCLISTTLLKNTFALHNCIIYWTVQQHREANKKLHVECQTSHNT